MLKSDHCLLELDSVPSTIATTCQTQPFHELVRNTSPTRHVHCAQFAVSAATSTKRNELFKFDAEVCPVVDILVAKSMQQALVELEREEMLEAVSCAAERGGFAQLSAIVEATQLEYACIMVNQQESSHCSHSASIQELQRDFKARFSSRHIMLMVLPSSMDQSSHSDCETLSVTTGSAGTYRPLLLRVWSLVAAATKRHYLIGQAAIDWVLYDLAQ
mmetsp:Transcript_207/g.555  ORF Transcript_207/g.555 Transcript_207/m.555 type:complete len:217 (-) Transcript_207:547-1197(-)